MSASPPPDPSHAASEGDADATAIQPLGRDLDLRIHGLLGVGEDGASYAATSPTLGAVELWRLRPGALPAEAKRRLVLLRTLQLPSLLPLHSLGEGPEPHLVVGMGGVAWNAPEVWPVEAAAMKGQLAGLYAGLAAAHRLDVVHGALGREHLGRRPDGRLVLDLTGLRVRAPAEPSLAPPGRIPGVPSPADDVWALAVLASASAAARALALQPFLEADPDRRSGARAAAASFAAGVDPGTLLNRPTLEEPPPQGAPAPTPDEEAPLHGVPRRLGAYHLIESIGAGGMGRVFRARDVGGGPDVALKVLMPQLAADEELVARFQREARVLARLQTPHVARFLAANEDAGFHYLVMELASGMGAERLLRVRTKLDVETALSIACDVARALAEVHELGLVHRDIKPSNILVSSVPSGPPTARLCDFGIARPQAPDSKDQLTREGAPGTPTFMSPEQVEGLGVDARSDVYSLGATLFAFLAGRPPFEGAAHFVMIAHVTEPAPPLTELEPTVPKAVAEVVARCLSKDPDERPRNGTELLEALITAWRGGPTEEPTLPQPLGLEGEPRVYDFTWSMRADPEELWPHVSNTDRLNRAAGLDEVEWSHTAEGGQVRTEGHFRAVGMDLRWKENPFEWVAPLRLGVVREYTAGPFLWLRSTVSMKRRPTGGTELRHRIEIRPRGLFGRAVASVEVGLRLRRGLTKVYERIDASCIGMRGRTASSPPPDPFEAPESAGTSVRALVDARVLRVLAAGADPHVLGALAEEACTAPAPGLSRLRPRAWARARGFAEELVLTAFLLAASEGLLQMQWDLLCPACRIASSMEDSLKALESHGHCDACDLDFELDLARSVELVFRVHPTVRDVEVGTYCIGGPAHSPHVLAQLRLAEGERFSLELKLPPGRYRVSGRGLPQSWPFAVDERAALGSWDLPLRAGASPAQPRSITPDRQRLHLTNDLGKEVLVRVERESDRDDAVTAAEAATHARFRELFPDQVLAPDRLVAISNVTILFAQVADALARYESDEGVVHSELMALAETTRNAVALEGGAVVRLQGNGVMAVFADRTAAVRVVLALREAAPTAGLALHAGPARMTTIGGRLDYFGRTLHVAETMGQRARPHELLVGETILAEPKLAALLRRGERSLGYLRIGTTLAERLVAGSASEQATAGSRTAGSDAPAPIASSRAG